MERDASSIICLRNEVVEDFFVVLCTALITPHAA